MATWVFVPLAIPAEESSEISRRGQTGMRVSDELREKTMKDHLKSTASLALMAVAALVMTAWASSAVADDEKEPAGTTWALSQQGAKYEVFRHRDDRPEHLGSLIYIVQTRTTAENIAHGLVFLQTSGSYTGEGFVSWKCVPDKDDYSLTCDQDIEEIKETLIIGAINSEACEKIRKKNQDMASAEKDEKKLKKLLTPDGKNPVSTTEECGETHPKGCVCYDISSDDTRDFPPNSGSGTGGHN
jgi:hypothetical protein